MLISNHSHFQASLGSGIYHVLCASALTIPEDDESISTRGMTTDDYNIFLVLKEIITLLFQQLIVIEISASCNDDSVFRD